MIGKIFCSAVLAASVSFGGIASVAAAPFPTQAGVETGVPVTNVDHRKKHRFYKKNGHAYYNGHRGYRHKRNGYRYHNGFWFPAAAFTLGLLLAPELRAERTIYLTPAHYRWCDDRYRSYRRWDNSFQPYEGPRRPCVSPYMR